MRADACRSLRDSGDAGVGRHSQMGGRVLPREEEGGRELQTEKTSASPVLHYKAHGCTQLVLKPREYEVGHCKQNMRKPASGCCGVQGWRHVLYWHVLC
jgi:hypothetical protein